MRVIGKGPLEEVNFAVVFYDDSVCDYGQHNGVVCSIAA